MRSIYLVNLTWYLRFIRMLQFLLVLKWCWSLRSFRMTFPLMPQQVKFIWRDEWDQMQHCSAKASNNSAGTKIKSGTFQVLGIRLARFLFVNLAWKWWILLLDMIWNLKFRAYIYTPAPEMHVQVQLHSFFSFTVKGMSQIQVDIFVTANAIKALFSIQTK